MNEVRHEQQTDSVGISRDDSCRDGCHTRPSRSSLASWWLVGSWRRCRWTCSRSSYRFKALLLWSGILRVRLRSGTILRCLRLRLWWRLLLRWWSLLLRWFTLLLRPTLQTLDRVLIECCEKSPGAMSRGFFLVSAKLFHVRYWPKADIARCAAHVRFWG